MLKMSTGPSRLGFAVLGVAVILAGCGGAQGVTSRSPAASHGERLAERHCATCHALTPTGAGPLGDAPSFPQLRALFSARDMAVILDRRMTEIHPRMPLLDMGPDELNAFLAYWDKVTPAAATKAHAVSKVENGRTIVVRDCGGCHATGLTGRSAFAAAPPFRGLGARYEIDGLAEALAEGISVGHPAMPELVYPAEDIEAILAYLKSIQPAAVQSATPGQDKS